MQWDLLFARFSAGQTRLVLATSDMPIDRLLGRSIVTLWGPNVSGEGSATPGGRSTHAEDVVYDAWEQVAGETLVHSTLLSCFDFEGMAKADSWDAASLIRGIEQWLTRDQRLIEIRTGKPITKAYFVCVEEGDAGVRVAKLIAGKVA